MASSRLGTIQTVGETGSTNADLVARLRAGEDLKEGVWLVADRQSAGKGRQGRQWTDSAGNFMGSTIVRLDGSEDVPSALSLLAGLAVYEALLPRIQPPMQPELKWPNDVMLAGGKLAGILLEREGNAVVVGIGVNLATAPVVEGREIVSLGQFGPVPDRDGFAVDLATAFGGELERWRTYGTQALLTRWLAVGHRIGTHLSVHEGNGALVSGAFDGLAPDGGLRLRLADGTMRVIHAGDVMLEGS